MTGPETIRLRIKSNGTPRGTVITDEHGRVLENVKSISWFISGSEPSRAEVTLLIMEAEISADFEVTKKYLPEPEKFVDYSAQPFEDDPA